MYLMWFDDNPKRPTGEKVAMAVEAYHSHFKARPNVVLVNKGTEAPKGVALRAANYARPNNYWVGWEDPSGLDV